MPNGTATVLVPSPMPVVLPPPKPDSTGRRRVHVKPPVIHIGSGPKQLRAIQFTNDTGDKARFWLLAVASLLEDGPPGNTDYSNPIVVDANKTLDIRLKPDLGYGDYHYHVYCDAIGNEAEGNSSPGMSCP
jgi:hypothetical protein